MFNERPLASEIASGWDWGEAALLIEKLLDVLIDLFGLCIRLIECDACGDSWADMFGSGEPTEFQDVLLLGYFLKDLFGFRMWGSVTKGR